MVKVIIIGWRPGMKTISFTKLLHEKGSMSLTEAKELKEKFITENQKIELLFKSLLEATEFVEEVEKLNVTAHIG